MQNYSGDLFRVVIITAGPQCSEEWWQVPAVAIPEVNSLIGKFLQEMSARTELKGAAHPGDDEVPAHQTGLPPDF